MIASATSRARDVPLESNCDALTIPRFTFAIGIGMPIRPVEQTRTSFAETPSCFAAISVISSASASPRAPVQAFALPEFTTMARARFPAARRALTFTGAAQT